MCDYHGPRSVIGDIPGGKIRIYEAIDRALARNYMAAGVCICVTCHGHIDTMLTVALTDTTYNPRPRTPQAYLRRYCTQLLWLAKDCNADHCRDTIMVSIFREIYKMLYRL
jgi:hypothetical protein